MSKLFGQGPLRLHTTSATLPYHNQSDHYYNLYHTIKHRPSDRKTLWLSSLFCANIFHRFCEWIFSSSIHDRLPFETFSRGGRVKRWGTQKTYSIQPRQISILFITLAQLYIDILFRVFKRLKWIQQLFWFYLRAHRLPLDRSSLFAGLHILFA